MANINNKIIGGEFALSHDLIMLSGYNNEAEEKKKNGVFFSSGRCALYSIFKDIEHSDGTHSREILIPDYLCESIIKTIIDAEWNYAFYHIGNDFHMDFNSKNMIELSKKAILLIDYFGMTDLSDDINRIRSQCDDVVIIVDCVQAYYSLDKYDVEYRFTSFRKWFPCADGALVLKKKSDSYVDIEMEDVSWAQYKYAGNLLKEYSDVFSDQVILKLLNQGESRLEEHYLCKCSDTGKKIYFSLNLEDISNRRRQNAKYLHEMLDELDIKHLYSENDTPLFIPILLPNRDEIRKEFFRYNIFTPKHWPTSCKMLNDANKLYDMELSLICDQRYTIEDMRRQVGVLKAFIRNS